MEKSVDEMTKAEMIAEIMQFLMVLDGEPAEAIAAMREKCLKGGEA